MRRRLLAAIALGLLPALLFAQTEARPAFEIVSIKPNRTNQGIPAFMFQPGGRVIGGNVDTQQIILVAYGLEEVQLVNAPDWVSTERFAVEARTNDATPSSTIRLMLRAMLADRFGFVAHSERRDLPMLALTMARPDERLGSRIRPSGSECAPIQPPSGVPIPPPPPPPPAGSPGPMRLILPTDEPPRRRCGAAMAPGWISARTITMREFARVLSQLTGRPVVDETGLADAYDLDMLFQPEGLRGAVVGTPPQAVSDAPALATALRDDLGLRLDARRGPVDVLVVDRIERPTEN